MAHKYLVDLTDEERGYLLDVIHKGKTTARRVARTHVLLQASTEATDERIAEMLHLRLSTVHRTRQRFVDDGLTAALSEQSRSGSPPALTGKQTAFLIALACSTPPAGRHRWTLKLLADRFVELRQIDMISPDTVGRVLKKTIANRGNVKKGVFPASVPTTSGIWRMSWTCTPNPMIPVIPKCVLAKTPCNLTSEARHPWPARPGQGWRYDYEYKREGTANLFLFVQPLRGWRHGATSMSPHNGRNRILLSKYACWWMSTSQPPNGFAWSWITSIPIPRPPCTAFCLRLKRVGSSANSSFTTPPSTAVGSIWPSVSWPCWPVSASIVVSRVSRSCAKRLLPGKARATSSRPKFIGRSVTKWPGPNSSVFIPPWKRHRI